ncbi:hypothetical protein [Microbacterium resistens]|uniref:hypothetical protein n=1 Tax=Microbacterium resistens TaxID=156977 RepID=UPI00082C26EF|nr:hypothetical protein [Microbacterium resistens]
MRTAGGGLLEPLTHDAAWQRFDDVALRILVTSPIVMAGQRLNGPPTQSVERKRHVNSTITQVQNTVQTTEGS